MNNKMFKLEIFLVFILSVNLVFAQTPSIDEKISQNKKVSENKPKVVEASGAKSVNRNSEIGVSGKKTFTFSEESFYSLYSELLKDYVQKDGQIIYSGIAADPRKLDKFLMLLESFPSSLFDELSREQKIAFWINAYNAFMIKVVSDHFPIVKNDEPKKNQNFPANSVRQISGAWNGIKKVILGKVLTLQEIEQNVLRKEFKDPRVHLALVKASKSSPLLLSEPYVGSKLDSQLTSQAKSFLRDPARFFIEKEDQKVRVSPIFDWYAKDFVAKYPPKGRFNRYPKENAAVLQFISEHLSEEDAEFLEYKAIKVYYLEYDWRLNDVNVPKIDTALE